MELLRVHYEEYKAHNVYNLEIFFLQVNNTFKYRMRIEQDFFSSILPIQCRYIIHFACLLLLLYNNAHTIFSLKYYTQLFKQFYKR